MSGRQLKVSVLVDLIDRLTSPLSRITSRMGALSSRIGVLGSAVAAISFATPIAQAAQWDSTIRNIGVTAGLSGVALERMISKTSADYEALALKVGQSSRDIAAGAGTLVAAGMDPKRIEALLPVIGKVATAANASFDDIAKTSFALSDSLRVPADQMEKALAGLVVAGKAGRFELADMSKYFPALTAQMASLKVTGTDAISTLGAGLQIAMKGAADPSQAANNMQNFLAKLSSPEVSRNFEKIGVDLSGVMQDAVAKGINPIEAVIQKVTTLTGVSADEISRAYATAKKSGLSDAAALAKIDEQVRAIGGAERLGKLFGDQQVLAFLLPMLANLKEYKAIAGEIRSATPEVTTTDFASQMAGLEKRMQRFTEIGEQLMRRVGRAFATNLGWINDGLQAVTDTFQWMDEMAPGSLDVLLALAGGFVAVAVGLGVLGPALGIVSAGLGILGAIVGVIFSPFILVIAAIAGAAALIIADWKTFKPFFERLWNGVKGIFTGALRAIKGLFSGDFAGMMRGLRLMWEGAKTAASAGWDIIKGVFFSLINRIKAIDWLDVGKSIMGFIIDGLSSLWSRAGEAGNWLAARIREIDWKTVGKDLSGWIIDGLKAYGNGVVEVASGIGAALRNFEWRAVGTAIIDKIGAAMAVVGNLISAVTKAMKDAFEGFDWAGVGVTIMNGIWEGMKSIASNITGWLNGAFTGNRNPTNGQIFDPNGTQKGSAGDGLKKDMNYAPIGGKNGLRQAAAPANSTVGGEIVVRVDRGTSAAVTRQANARVPIVADRGLMLGRA
jgi:hypothetical protein